MQHPSRNWCSQRWVLPLIALLSFVAVIWFATNECIWTGVFSGRVEMSADFWKAVEFKVLRVIQMILFLLTQHKVRVTLPDVTSSVLFKNQGSVRMGQNNTNRSLKSILIYYYLTKQCEQTTSNGINEQIDLTNPSGVISTSSSPVLSQCPWACACESVRGGPSCSSPCPGSPPGCSAPSPSRCISVSASPGCGILLSVPPGYPKI